MNVVVIGQRGDEPVRRRTVTPVEFMQAWGPYGLWLWENARDQTAIIGDIRIRVVLTA